MPDARVLFVCLGNICRSPTAEGVFRARVERARLTGRIEADSAGTAAYHLGKPPDRRATAAAAVRGVDLSGLRARQVERADFTRFDWILAMDEENLADLRRLAPRDASARLALFLDGAEGLPAGTAVPDPYYGGPEGFERVLDLVERGADGWFARLRREHGL